MSGRLLAAGMHCLASILVASASGADARRLYRRPTISFSQTPFTVTYGGTRTLCATVTPASKASLFTNMSAWADAADADGVFMTTPGTDPACTGPGKVSLTIKSNFDKCLPQGKVRAGLRNRNTFVEAASVTGNVALPNRETMSNMNSPIRDCSIFDNVSKTPWDYMEQWLATFKRDTTDLDLRGVPFSEILTTLTNTCSGSLGTLLPPGTVEGPNGGPLPGVGAPNPNQWIDLIGFCGAILAEGELPPTNCSVTRRQAVSVGACPIQNNIMTVSFSPAGAVSTNRVVEVASP